MRRRDFLYGLSGAALTPSLALYPRLGSAARQDATPATTAGDGSLADLLGLVPDILARPEPPQYQLAMYANPALQLASLGLRAPTSRDDDEAVSLWIRANWWTTLPDPVRTRSLSEDWRPTFGFDVFQVDQSLVAGDPPSLSTVYRGHFDPDELRAAWTASGYKPVDVEGAEAYSFREDGSFDMSSVVSQLALSQMNNAAILPDGAVLFAQNLDLLKSIVAAANGDEPSLGQHPDVADLVSALDPAITDGFLVPGDTLRGNAADLLGESATSEQIAAVREQLDGLNGDQPPMPRPRLAAIMTTAGGPIQQPLDGSPATPTPQGPIAHGLIALLMDDQTDAESAIPIVDARLTDGTSFVNMRPYTDYFADWDLSVASAEPVLLVDLVPASEATPGVLFQMFYQRDLLFVAWRDDEATPAAG